MRDTRDTEVHVDLSGKRMASASVQTANTLKTSSSSQMLFVGSLHQLPMNVRFEQLLALYSDLLFYDLPSSSDYAGKPFRALDKNHHFRVTEAFFREKRLMPWMFKEPSRVTLGGPHSVEV